jgi:hypothetical protein
MFGCGDKNQMDTRLGNLMINLADKSNLPSNHKLRTQANEFNSITEKYFKNLDSVNVSDFTRIWHQTRDYFEEYKKSKYE